MLARLRTISEAEFSQVPYGGEGLWSKVRKACREGGSVGEIIRASKSKRYAYTRLSRLLLCACLGLTEADFLTSPPYVRVLAFRDRGRSLLKMCREQGTISLLHAGENAPPSAYAELETRCALFYDLFCELPNGNYQNRRQNQRIFYHEKKEKGLAK